MIVSIFGIHLGSEPLLYEGFTFWGLFHALSLESFSSLVPFAMLTEDNYHPGISCLFEYLTLIVLIGCVLFFMMAKTYK